MTARLDDDVNFHLGVASREPNIDVIASLRSPTILDAMAQHSTCTEGMALESARTIFADQPTLRLTPSQLMRLLGSTPEETSSVLQTLTAKGVLSRTADGHFISRGTTSSRPASGGQAPANGQLHRGF